SHHSIDVAFKIQSTPSKGWVVLIADKDTTPSKGWVVLIADKDTRNDSVRGAPSTG
ncbi:hypothetical protein Tco_0334623, partial [Tanacetum coccineum]